MFLKFLIDIHVCLCSLCDWCGRIMQQSFLQARCEETLVTSDWGIPLLVALLLLLLVYAFLYLPAISYRALLQQALSNHTEAMPLENNKTD